MRFVIVLAGFLSCFSASGQWDIQNSRVTADLRGIDYVGGDVAWASGSNGTILRTVDKGHTWQLCTVPPDAGNLDFRGVQAFDKDTAIVMSSGLGDRSRLYKTMDACQTWKLVFTNPDKDGSWEAIRFSPVSPYGNENQRFGVIVGSPVEKRFRIFGSYDFGSTWEENASRVLAREPRSRAGESLFASSNSAADNGPFAGDLAFVTGGSGGARYFHFIGPGLIFDALSAAPRFEITQLPLPHSTNSQGAFSIAHRRDNAGPSDTMIVGGDQMHPEAIGSSVFLPEATYRFLVRHQEMITPTAPPLGYRSAVAYEKNAKAWITVGPNGTDISVDDGRNWRAMKPGLGDSPDADKNWNAISLPFVVGQEGRIGVLRDLGK